jgi:hypothetical protein
MNRRTNRSLKFVSLLAVLVMSALFLSACPAVRTVTPIATAPLPTPTPMIIVDYFTKVGIVLPTKDEPRWVQDETRFNDAFKAAVLAKAKVQTTDNKIDFTAASGARVAMTWDGLAKLPPSRAKRLGACSRCIREYYCNQAGQPPLLQFFQQK